MKPKLMIIGAGENQVPIIKRANQMGFYTIVVSIDGNYPGFEVADKSYRIDVRDREKILKLAEKDKINGILTDQTDISVLTVAYIAEKMELPGIGYECALRFTNKFIMRESCENIGIPVPKYFQAKTLDVALVNAADLGFPLIIKPVDNQGSRGVIQVNNINQLKEDFFITKAYSNTGYVILERFFSGKEIVIEGFASDYKFSNLIIGDSCDFELPNKFIPRHRFFPTSINKTLKDKILECNKRLIEGFDLEFGITHSEYLVNEDTEEICLMEVAARGGGAFISSDLIPLSSGIDVSDLLIQIASGKKVELDKIQIMEKASGYIYFYLPSGKIISIEGLEELRAISGIHKVFLEGVQIGQQIETMTDKTMRLGPILIYGSDREELECIIKQIKETLIIEVETDDGIQGIIW